jgi:hypothetical protein
VALAALEQRAFSPLVSSLEQKGEWRLEPVGNLLLVRRQGEVRRNDRDDRCHDISSHRPVRLDRPDYFSGGRIEQELFVGFTQGRFDCIFPRIDAAAGKGDLARVRAHMLAPDGKEHARFGPIGNGDQHSRLGRSLRPKLGQIPFE